MDVPSRYNAAVAAAPADNSTTQWWLAFRDARLTSLIDQGLRQNLGIAQAVERINEAIALVETGRVNRIVLRLGG